MRKLAFLLPCLCCCATVKTYSRDVVDCAKQQKEQILQSVPSMLSALAQQEWMAAAQVALIDAKELNSCALQTIAAAGGPLASKAQAALGALALVPVNAPTAP